jgi:hypothetical protein
MIKYTDIILILFCLLRGDKRLKSLLTLFHIPYLTARGARPIIYSSTLVITQTGYIRLLADMIHNAGRVVLSVKLH